ncbi:MAG: hypothetical protein GY710_26375 [Desulfobacteraceae bacterium]|nr:hypothetical protein [Desulfobacteraceae bacterium]
MKLFPKNKRIEIDGEDLVQVLREIELLLLSLHKIGSYYTIADDVEKANYEKETTRFIDEWKVTARLSEVRTLLSKHFDLTLADDDMDDLERAMQSLNYWSNPESSPKT